MSTWVNLVSRFQGIVITLSRCYFHLVAKHCTIVLHGFCDASTAAYAAVAYLCFGSESAHFVAAKTRVTQQTVPRLELLSCLLLARLVSHVLEALQNVIEVKAGSCFTDSRVALYWILGDNKQWKQFVHNRAVEIQRLVPAQHWKHCTGRPSHGITPENLDASLTWKHGPDWLPTFTSTDLSDDPPIMSEDCATEMRTNNCHSLLTATQRGGIEQLIDCTHYS